MRATKGRKAPAQSGGRARTVRSGPLGYRAASGEWVLRHCALLEDEPLGAEEVALASALDNAARALESLDAGSLTELKALGIPADAVVMVASCCVVLTAGKPKVKRAKVGAADAYTASSNDTPREIAARLGVAEAQFVALNAKTYPGLTATSRLKEGQILRLASASVPKDVSWAAAKKMMGNVGQFLDSLLSFDTDNVDDVLVAHCEKVYLSNPDFEYENIKNKSPAAAGLCSWCINICKYCRICQVRRGKEALAEAAKALDGITGKDIQDLKALKSPPEIIRRIMDTVLILMHKRLEPVSVVEGKVCPVYASSYEHAMRYCIGNPKLFLDELRAFPKENINDETVELLQPYLDFPDFNVEIARRGSGSVAGLCAWAAGMSTYQQIAKVVGPQIEALEAADNAEGGASAGGLRCAQLVLMEHEGGVQLETVRLVDRTRSSALAYAPLERLPTLRLTDVDGQEHVVGSLDSGLLDEWARCLEKACGNQRTAPDAKLQGKYETTQQVDLTGQEFAHLNCAEVRQLVVRDIHIEH